MRQHPMTRWGRLLLGGLLGCVGVAALVVGLILFQNYRKAQAGAAPEVAAASAPKAPRPVRVGTDTLEIPPEVVRSLDVRTAPAAAATRPRPLPPFTGVLAPDNDRLARVHTRFAGEVVALGTPAGKETTDLPGAGSSGERPVSVGDSVRKGQLLAVVWSKDLGEKKSELVDGLSKLKYDRKQYDQMKALFDRGAKPEQAVLDAELAIQGDLNAVAKAERTLRSWRLTDAEITAVREEAERLVGLMAAKAQDGHVSDPAWARVEVRAPIDGVILEKNVNFGDVVDTTGDLFKVGDRGWAVWVHVFEEDLPQLQDPKLPHPLPWTIRVPAMPGVTFAGHLEAIRDIIDPNQHTALAVGHIDNPNGLFKAGQFVTATVELPPSPDEIEVPATALVEDGRESIVFVQPDADKLRFSRRQVKVLRRFHDVVYLSGKPTEGKGDPIRAGDRVVTGGAVFMNDALADLPTS
jgi:cobalt-zinc-cadmium efflux system membrane fusion protein